MKNKNKEMARIAQIDHRLFMALLWLSLTTMMCVALGNLCVLADWCGLHGTLRLGWQFTEVGMFVGVFVLLVSLVGIWNLSRMWK